MKQKKRLKENGHSMGGASGGGGNLVVSENSQDGSSDESADDACSNRGDVSSSDVSPPRDVIASNSCSE